MFKLKVIQHIDADTADLNEVISVKSVAWPYTPEEQLQWLNKNLGINDLHLLLLFENTTVAYLNLINIELEINHEKINSFGIGNVCAKEKRRGFGNELMKFTNKFLSKKKKPGLLFCKPELVDFYKKSNWKVIEKNKLSLSFDNQKIETMLYNFGLEVELLSYNGKSF